MIRVLYAGSPEASRNLLSRLYEMQASHQFEIAGVITNPPSARGRHGILQETAVALFAKEKNIAVFAFEHLDERARNEIKTLHADVLACFAYGHIFGPKFLSLFKYGGVNVHPSLLPKYRGPSPVNAAILNMDGETAITVQTLSPGMDEGDILLQEKIRLTGSETASGLLKKTWERGSELLAQILYVCDAEKKMPEGKKQTGLASYTKTISKADCKIDWNESAKKIDAHIRAYSEEPGAWTHDSRGILKILRACILDEKEIAAAESADETSRGKDGKKKCGEVLRFQKGLGILVQTGSGIVCIRELQREGKKALSAEAFVNGARNFEGSVLGS